MNSDILKLPNVSIRQIQMCVAVHRLGSLSAAGEVLGVSPSAISMGIREAEAQLGCALFHRGKRQLSASESGRSLFSRMEELLRQVDELQSVAANPEGPQQGHLVVGASSTLGCYVLPSVIARFREKFPLVDIDLSVGNTAGILDKLIHYSVDIAFVEGPSMRDDCELESLWADEMVVFAKKGHSLMKKRKVHWQQLAEQRWLLREEGSGTHSILAARFAQHGIHPNRAIHVGNTEAVIRCVEQGLGIACLSRFAIQRSLDMGWTEVLPVKPIKRRFFHATIQRRYLSRLGGLFLQEMQQYRTE